MHLVVTNDKNESWILSTVYSPIRLHDQCYVWKELSSMASLNLPWFLSVISTLLFLYMRFKVVLKVIIIVRLRISLTSSSRITYWKLISPSPNLLGAITKLEQLGSGLALIGACLTPTALPFFIHTLLSIFRIFSQIMLPFFSQLLPVIFTKRKFSHFDNFWLEYIAYHSVVREAWNFKPYSNPMHAFTHLIAHARFKLIS